MEAKIRLKGEGISMDAIVTIEDSGWVFIKETEKDTEHEGRRYPQHKFEYIEEKF